MDGGHSLKNKGKSQNEIMEKESSNLKRREIESSDRDSNNLMSEDNSDSEDYDKQHKDNNQNIRKGFIQKSSRSNSNISNFNF